MRIERQDIVTIGVCAIAGIGFVYISTMSTVTALTAGIASGALGGVVASISRHLLNQASDVS